MESIAIIGTGISGMGCAHYLQRSYQLDVYEQNSYVGGHTNTVYVKEGERKIPIDTGFIVFNHQTYPNLLKLFRELGVETKPTDMSFGVQYLPRSLEYSSKHLFAQKKNYLNPRFWSLLVQINKFYKEAEEVLHNEKFRACSIADYTASKGFNNQFVNQYLVPMGSALWSTPPDTTLQYPVRTLVNFLKNHGMLSIGGQHQWYTVHNGSWQYRDKLIAPFLDKIKLNDAVVSVARQDSKVVIRTKSGVEKIYDKVIIATHADQALRLLEDASALEKESLLPFQYQANVAKLHTDESVMPKIKSTWSAWNYRVQESKDQLSATTIYWMNKLQQLPTQKNYFVSINDPGLIDERKVLRTIHYEHPIFTPSTEVAQEKLHRLNENGVTYFCGSYFKYGFHEDALSSAVQVCEKLLSLALIRAKSKQDLLFVDIEK